MRKLRILGGFLNLAYNNIFIYSATSFVQTSFAPSDHITREELSMNRLPYYGLLTQGASVGLGPSSSQTQTDMNVNKPPDHAFPQGIPT